MGQLSLKIDFPPHWTIAQIETVQQRLREALRNKPPMSEAEAIALIQSILKEYGDLEQGTF